MLVAPSGSKADDDIVGGGWSDQRRSDPQLNALDQRGCFAQQVFPVGFFAGHSASIARMLRSKP